jgi:hypothetical protein
VDTPPAIVQLVLNETNKYILYFKSKNATITMLLSGAALCRSSAASCFLGPWSAASGMLFCRSRDLAEPVEMRLIEDHEDMSMLNSSP